MRKKRNILIYPLVIMGMCLILASSCNKEHTQTNVTDIDGNVYHTVTIGTQVWMVENLKTTKYRDGTSIPNVTDNTTWSSLTTSAYCDYNNTPSNSATYGRLYNWYAVTNVHNIAPTGWHVPTDAEWSVLINYLDPNADGGNNTNVAGGKLKSIGTQYWESPNTGADNSSGFSGLPGGNRFFSGSFYDIGYNGYWWSSSEVVTYYVWYRYLNYKDGNVGRFYFNKNYGFSVRCLRD